MSNHTISGAALAALLLGSALPSAAQAQRAYGRAPQASRSVDQYPAARSRPSDLYSVERGRSGTITATTPNQSGNFGGPSTGGGGGGGP